jgi:putative component of membrane protein insertase Oxa1/YidC/SpoIIIJ protein YidD
MNTKAPSSSKGLYSYMIDFYRGPLNHLAAVRKGECPMHPSCSEYSQQAIQKHGWMVGWMMSHDRLLRCGRDEMKLAPRVVVNGQRKYYDPVKHNDFWWASAPKPD